MTTVNSVNTYIVATATNEVTMPLQPAFGAYLGSDDTNVTGNGTVYTLGTNVALTEVFDQNADFNVNGTLTSPVTGRYFIECTMDLTTPAGNEIGGVHRIVTSNASYKISMNPDTYTNGSGGSYGLCIHHTVDMDAADTATFTVEHLGNVADTSDIRAPTAKGRGTVVSGFLVY